MSTTTIGASVGAAGFGVGGDALTQDAWIVSGRDGVSGGATRGVCE